MSTSNDNKPPSLLKKTIKKNEMKQVWTFYYLIPAKYNADKNVDWKNYLNILHDFNTFEDFWAIIASIEPAWKLQKGCRYYIFKKGIEPLWEDKANLGGKEISIEFKHPQKQGDQKQRRADNQELNKIQKACEEKWIRLCASVFCNNEKYFKNIDKINGIEFNIRAQIIKVGIWTEKVTDEEFHQLVHDLHEIMEYKEGGDPIASAKENDISLDRITK
ncbi:hypothetical protein M9Y10_020306 [Tritrichomonas musculus]|uniref:Uncharacterized protein n=1 Tax=Tritrichomonas musculus TaxID=1915356 RepID=A0ABR2HHV8_9EUKA